MNYRASGAISGIFSIISIGSLIGLNSCGGSSGAFTTSTTIRSSNLVSTASSLVSESRVSKSAVTGLNQASHPCPTGTTTCYSPSAMGGKFLSFTIRIGTQGIYYRLELIRQASGSDGDTPTSSMMNSFELGSPTAISGSPSTSEVTFDSSSAFKDLVWNVGWIDAKFPANTFNSVGEATLRFVYFTDSVTGYQKGDILIRDGSDFKWCPTGTTSIASCTTTRPGSPITQNTGIVNYTPATGDPTLPYLVAELFNDSTGVGLVTASASDLAGTTNITVDFDHANAFAIESTSPGPFSTIFEVMPLLYLRGFSAVPTGVSVAGGISAVLSISH